MFSFLSLEPDKNNLFKYRKIVKIAKKNRGSLKMVTISVSSDEVLKIDASINIVTNSREEFYNDFCNYFDRRRKFDDDDIARLVEMKNVRAEFFDIDENGSNEELEKFLKNLRAKKMLVYLKFNFVEDECDYESTRGVREYLDSKMPKKCDCNVFECHYYSSDENKISVSFYVQKL